MNSKITGRPAVSVGDVLVVCGKQDELRFYWRRVQVISLHENGITVDLGREFAERVDCDGWRLGTRQAWFLEFNNIGISWVKEEE